MGIDAVLAEALSQGQHTVPVLEQVVTTSNKDAAWIAYGFVGYILLAYWHCW
jgi:hypothetical protein